MIPGKFARPLFSFLGPSPASSDEDDSATRGRRPLRTRDYRRMYDRPPSFTDLLPWVDYSEEHRCVLFEDGVSVGAWIELTPVGCEARPEAWIQTLHRSLQDAITDSFPEYPKYPWVVQWYVQDAPSSVALYRAIRDYVHPNARDSAFTLDYLERMESHLSDVARPGGLFVDKAITGGPWRGSSRRVHCMVYRRSPAADKYAVARAKAARAGSRSLLRELFDDAELLPWEELDDVLEKFIPALSNAGVSSRRCRRSEFREYMIRWFNTNPDLTGGDTDHLIDWLDGQVEPGTEARPAGFDLSDGLLFSQPRSDVESGCWFFDEQPQRTVSVQGLRRIPRPGHITAEHRSGDHVFALFDKLPEGTIMAQTLVVKPQDEILDHIHRIRRAAISDAADAVLAGQDAEDAEYEISRGNKIYPMSMAFYIRGEDMRDLHTKVNRTTSVLISAGLIPILERSDLLALDTYLLNLPGNYDPEIEKTHKRSRLTFSRDIAALAPFYGRSTGTGNPGFLFFNRGGEALTFDPLNRHDRKQNGHLLMLGPTGAGKSATLILLIMQALAIYRPRVFIIEAGNSFGLFLQHCQAMGLTTNSVQLTASSNVSLPPFADAIKALEAEGREMNDDDEENPDYLGGMEITAKIMITGGDPRELEKYSPSDKMMVRGAILAAARDRKAAGDEHVAAALRETARDPDLPDRRRERAIDMADAMSLFCGGIEGRFFNRPGAFFPDVDVTHMEMGLFAQEGNMDKLTVAYIGMMNRINALVERTQNDDRPTIVVTDEGHLITTSPLLSPYVVKMTKMWRKLGCWLWLGTQNLEDFPDASKKMLNMMEWWLCLVMPKEEIDQIARFKALTDEQRSLLQSAYKEPGKYIEGVVLSKAVTALFRNVPPALPLALAMTEKHEKAERQELMKEHGCTELEAAYMVADRIAQKRA